MKDYEEIEKSLDKLIDDFSKQMVHIDDNTNFHNSIIELSSKYPEHKELLEFIVMVNDKLETKHSVFSDLVSDSFIELMKLKKEVLHELKRENDKQKTTNSKKTSIIDNFKKITLKDTKTILILISIIITGITVIFSPDTVVYIIEHIEKILKGKG